MRRFIFGAGLEVDEENKKNELELEIIRLLRKHDDLQQSPLLENARLISSIKSTK